MQILNYVIIKHQGSLVNDSAIPKTHDVYQEQASSGTSYSGSSSSEAANQVLTVNAANTSFTQKYTLKKKIYIYCFPLKHNLLRFQ